MPDKDTEASKQSRRSHFLSPFEFIPTLHSYPPLPHPTISSARGSDPISPSVLTDLGLSRLFQRMAGVGRQNGILGLVTDVLCVCLARCGVCFALDLMLDLFWGMLGVRGLATWVGGGHLDFVGLDTAGLCGAIESG